MKKSIILICSFLMVSQLFAQDALDLYNSGTDKYAEGNTLGAIKDYTAAITMDSSYAIAYLGRGSVYAEIQQFELAEEDLTTCIMEDPTITEAFFNRAFVYIAQGKFDLALNDLNMYVIMKPNDMSGYLARIDILVDMNEQVRVYEDFDKIMTLPAYSPEEFVQRGRVKVLMRDTLGGLKDYDSALMLQPSYMDAYFDRATVFYQTDLYNKAIEDLNIYLLNIENDWQAFEMRGECYGRMGEYTFAVDDYDRALKINPENADAYFNRAYFLMKMERYEPAIVDFKKAVVYGFKDSRYLYYNKGNAEYQIGNKEQACKDWSKAGDLGASNKDKFCN